MAQAGSVVWPSANEPLWRFNWRLADLPDEEGIVITDAYYRGYHVFYKASLPILRVKYDIDEDGGCGPYKDPLCYNNARTTSRCPASRVCLYSYVSNGLRALGIDSYHTGNPGLGNYHLTHRWVFWEHGPVYPRLYSAGLQCNMNHRHHAYWRLDFDIDQATNNLALEYNTYTGDLGWGRGWEPQITEVARSKNPPSRRSWAVMNGLTGRGYHIIPGPNDGMPDAWSTHDLWLHLYNGNEDRSGRQGNASRDGLNDYINGQNVDHQDVVLWYCGHLHHNWRDGGNDWHMTGPYLIPFDSWV
jgi:Copper amine oxidase, enzyme domain